MRFLSTALGLILIAISMAALAFWNSFLVQAPAGISVITFVFAFLVFVGGISAFFHGISEGIPERVAEGARRLAMGSLTGAAFIAGSAAFGILLHLSADGGSGTAWIEPFYVGVFFAAVIVCPLGLWKTSLESVAESESILAPDPFVPDPYDPPDPDEEMIEPDPGPMLGALLARKRSLNLARSR